MLEGRELDLSISEQVQLAGCSERDDESSDSSNMWGISCLAQNCYLVKKDFAPRNCLFVF